MLLVSPWRRPVFSVFLFLWGMMQLDATEWGCQWLHGEANGDASFNVHGMANFGAFGRSVVMCNLLGDSHVQ